MKFKDMDVLRIEILDEYRKRIDRSHESWNAGFTTALYFILDKIRSLPETEVEAVVHGAWIEDGSDIVCSACGAAFDFELRRLLPGNMPYPAGCPACRAKMDYAGLCPGNGR